VNKTKTNGPWHRPADEQRYHSIYKFVFASSGFEIGPAPFGNQSQDQNNLNFVDTVSWVKGAHVFRFGGEFTRVSLDKNFPQVFNGELFFTNTPDGNTDFQNFLLGTPQFSFGGGGLSNHKYRANDYAFFVQHDWKFRSNLTLNLGLRTKSWALSTTTFATSAISTRILLTLASFLSSILPA